MESLAKQVQSVISYSQGVDIDIDECKDLIGKWEKNKAHFIEKWGGTSIEMELPITLDMSAEEKTKRKMQIIRHVAVWSNLPAHEKVALLDMLESVEVDDIFNNRLSEDFQFSNSYNKMVKINAGAKLSKSLKVFFKDAPESLESVQNVISQAVQDSKITGKLVLSVHPLDFLSTAETTLNWRSCHALDGEYRAGGMSYMLDKHTFIAYLKSEKEAILPNFPPTHPWTNKKWRTLFYYCPKEQVLISGKQYPFYHTGLFDLASGLISNTLELGDDYCDWTQESGYKLQSAMRDCNAEASLHFNDVFGSSDDRYMRVYKSAKSLDEIQPENRMVIGSGFNCLTCGMHEVEMPSSFQCFICGDFHHCESCGRVQDDHELCSLSGMLMCEDCWCDSAVFCHRCEDAHHYDDGELTHIGEDGYEGDYCPYCYDLVLEQIQKEK